MTSSHLLPSNFPLLNHSFSFPNQIFPRLITSCNFLPFSSLLIQSFFIQKRKTVDVVECCWNNYTKAVIFHNIFFIKLQLNLPWRNYAPDSSVAYKIVTLYAFVSHMVFKSDYVVWLAWGIPQKLTRQKAVIFSPPGFLLRDMCSIYHNEVQFKAFLTICAK